MKYILQGIRLQLMYLGYLNHRERLIKSLIKIVKYLNAHQENSGVKEIEEMKRRLLDICVKENRCMKEEERNGKRTCEL